MCRQSFRPVVLMVNEVDSASNNQVFIDFLAQLRGYYLARNVSPIFHSVILAGVYDIKNLKLELRDLPEERVYWDAGRAWSREGIGRTDGCTEEDM